MKTHLLILSFLFSSSLLFAQREVEPFQKGDILGYANFSLQNNASESKTGSSTFESNNNSFGVGLGAYAFVSDNLAAGLSVGFSNSSSKSGSTINNESSIFTVSPGVKYFNPCGESENFGVVGGFRLNTGFGSRSTPGVGTDLIKEDRTDFGATLSSGIYYRPNDKLMVSLNFANLNYGQSTYKNSEADSEFSNKRFDFDIIDKVDFICFFYTF